MKCHYEILGVNRDAEDSEIKKCYRKLALQWHPDKNPQNPDAAREQFQLIQQAYEVLSDSHERAFYDNHREQILRGKNSDYEDSSLDVFQYFTVTCFKGYGDDANGFYHIYSEIFEKIAAEDSEFLEDEEDISKIPKFGNSQSSYDDVVGPFYAYWQSYCTKRSYTWLCKYDITEIKDRRILREVEKETKKLAQKARKERNEEVRNLVSFVRKRDKRVLAYRKLLEEKAEQNRKKQEQNRLEQIRKRQREIEEIKNSHVLNSLKPDGYEEQLRQLEQEYGGDDIDTESCSDECDENIEKDNLSEEPEFYDDLYCIACNKAFKNENAFVNHEISQKHLANVDKLKARMTLEESEYVAENEENLNIDCDSPLETKVDSNIKETDLLVNIEDGEVSVEEDEEIKEGMRKSKKKKLKKAKQPIKIESDTDEEHEEIPDLLETLQIEKEENWQDDSKKSGKKTKGKKTNQQPSRKVVKESLETTKELPAGNSADVAVDISHVCATCKSNFDSKNKLFAHLKKTNHGVYIPKQAMSNPITNGHSTKKGKKK